MSTSRRTLPASKPGHGVGLIVCIGILAVGLLSAPLPASAGDRESGLARLVGVWQIDQRVSDDPQRLLRQADRGSVPRQGKEKPRSEFGERVSMVTEGANVLTIAYAEGVATLTDWHDAVQTLQVDGKRRSAERGGNAVEVEAGWKSSDRLVVKTTGVPGGWIRETYELGERGDKLFVTVELQRKGSRFPFAFDRLYHRAVAQD